MKNKESSLLIFVKGFVIGLGIIFPISASGLAVSLGIYERLLHIINNLKTSLKEELKFIIPFIIGIILSAIFSCVMINFTYKKYPVATLLFFEGLVIGGLPLIFKKTEYKYKLSNFLCLILGVVALISLSLFKTSGNIILNTNLLGLSKIFLIGMLAAGSMIIPGVSGSVILVILGYYEPLLEIINNTLKLQSLGTNLIIIGIFGIGMILGILIVSKIMDFFLNKYPVKSYFAVVGFIIASIINILVLIFSYKVKVIEILIGIILLIFGYMISFKFLKEE